VSALAAAKAILEADATLLATATGGVWDYDETGRLGLSRELTQAAFDANGIIKPCVLIKSRSITPDYILADDANQYVSTREVIECWLYEDTGYANITTMGQRIFVLLHARQLDGTFAVRWAGDLPQPLRDTDLDASLGRSDYTVIGRRSA
jgi:hypothetical protein